MHIKTRNVNTAFHTFVSMFHTSEYQGEDGAYGRLAGEKISISKRPSRNGNVMMIDEPVTVTYTHPRERVLFNADRDANPFFHLYEALWMLAGRNDVESVAYYAKQMREYSDDGKTLNGAYGYRWRHSFAGRYSSDWGADTGEERVDQLDILINHLKANPNSRRAVLSMWNVEDDLLKIGGGPLPSCTCGADRSGPSAEAHSVGCPASKPARTDGVWDLGSRDVCCNLSVMFLIRDEEQPPWEGSSKTKVRHLDMTVTNRSNDMIWGMLGANYVHFTFLQEYIAGCLGVEVGRYHHFTNNLHVYDWNWKPEEWLEKDEEGRSDFYQWHPSPSIKLLPLVKDQATFDRELQSLVGNAYGHNVGVIANTKWEEPFIQHVAMPVLMAFHRYKTMVDKSYALAWCEAIKSDDWRIACTEWIKRRIAKEADPSTASVGETSDILNKENL